MTDAKLSSSVRSSISSASSTAAEAIDRVRLANIAKGIVANSWAATGGNDFQIDVEATNGHTASSIFSSDGASFWRDGKKMWLKQGHFENTSAPFFQSDMVLYTELAASTYLSPFFATTWNPMDPPESMPTTSLDASFSTSHLPAIASTSTPSFDAVTHLSASLASPMGWDSECLSGPLPRVHVLVCRHIVVGFPAASLLRFHVSIVFAKTPRCR